MVTIPRAAPPTSSARLAQTVVEELWFGDEDPERSEQEASLSLAAALGIATGLKPFPVALQRVLALLADPDAPRNRVTELIEQDPSLCIQLLRVANSALYAPTRRCERVADAVLRLGNRSVSEIIASIVVFGMFADVEGVGLRVRDHCAGVGAIARVLATEWRHGGTESIFLPALLHDVGKLLMMQAGAPRYELLSQDLLEFPDRVHVEERRLTGYDHATLGGHVIQAWQLPLEVARVVAWHHQPARAYEEGGELGLSVALLRMADCIEMELAQGRPLDGAFAELLARDEAAQYAGFSPHVLDAMGAKLTRARAETVAALAPNKRR